MASEQMTKTLAQTSAAPTFESHTTPSQKVLTTQCRLRLDDSFPKAQVTVTRESSVKKDWSVYSGLFVWEVALYDKRGDRLDEQTAREILVFPTEGATDDFDMNVGSQFIKTASSCRVRLLEAP
jgi:hypothetical protein